MRGKFIVLEGMDGSGKSTQVKRLATYLRDELHVPVYVTREPSDGPIGKLTRSEFQSGKQKLTNMQDVIYLSQLLILADRIDHVTNKENGIDTILNQGINVICDRYYLSTLAYYGASFLKAGFQTNNFITLANSIEPILDMKHMIQRFTPLQPDLMIVLQTDPEICLERIQSRNGEKDVMESMDDQLSWLKDLSLSYKYSVQLIHDEISSIVTINGNREEETVTKQIQQAIKDYLLL